MTDQVHVGMLDAGFIGQMHSLALCDISHQRRPLPLAIVKQLLVDTNPDQLRETAARYRWKQTSAEWHDLVADKTVELLINAAPNHLHAEPCRLAAKQGKHIFCEKPLGRSEDEAFSLWREVAGSGVTHMCGFLYRFVPAIRLARNIIKGGEIGDIIHFRSQFLLNMETGGARNEWRFDRARAGAGALGDLGSHHVDIARFLIADPISVRAARKTRSSGSEVLTRNDDWFAAIATLENGATAVFEASRIAGSHALTGEVQIDGMNGSLTFSLERLNELNIRRPGQGVATINVLRRGDPFVDFFLPVGLQGSHPIGWRDCFAFQLEHFLRCLANGEPLGPEAANFEDGYKVAAVVEAIEQSARDGKEWPVKFRCG